MDLAEIIRRLSAMPERGVRVVADGAGVPFHTILKIRNGQTENPRYATVERLVKYFEGQQCAASHVAHNEAEAA